MNYKKISITIPNELLQEIEEKAKKIGLNRSSYISFKLSEGSKQDKAMESLMTLVDVMKKKQEQESGK